MTNNNNINSDQKPERKSHQEQTQEGKKKEEINPNTPKANQNSQRVPLQGNQPAKGKVNLETDIEVRDQVEKLNEKSSSKRSMH
jgi:hypothetical protein